MYKKIKDNAELRAKIEQILDNKPALPNSYGRLDKEGNLA